MALANKAKRTSTQLLSSSHQKRGPDFLPLEGGPGHKLPRGDVAENKATVLYVGRIPHGFYEDELEGNADFSFAGRLNLILRFFFAVRNHQKVENRAKQEEGDMLGPVWYAGKGIRLENRSIFGFIEFEYPKVAEIVSESMHNYLLFEHILQVYLIPSERVRPKLWKGINRRYDPVDFVQVERKRQNKERTLEEHKKPIERILKRDRKRRNKIEADGIDYECPEIVGADLPAPKKIKFDDNDE